MTQHGEKPFIQVTVRWFTVRSSTAPAAGAVVTLHRGRATIAQRVADARGHARFENLPSASDYSVSAVFTARGGTGSASQAGITVGPHGGNPQPVLVITLHEVAAEETEPAAETEPAGGSSGECST